MARRRVIAIERVQRALVRTRGEVVMLDSDLARLYEVDVKVLNQAVKRNRARFPPDFMFQLDPREADALRSQIVTAKSGRGGRRTAPYAFTEQGVAMLSSVLRSSRAISVNIQIMRTFVHVRPTVIAHKDLANKLASLERKYDGQFTAVFAALRELMRPAAVARRPIGFVHKVPRPSHRSARP